jgi:VWFA-related protein
MPAKWSLTVGALCLLSAAVVAGQGGPASAPQGPAGPTAGAPATSQQSGYVLKVTTRLVTVDLVATDSRGNPVRDLKPEEVQILEERKAQQKIEHFEFIEKMKSAGGPAQEGSLSNQLPLDQLKVPPTVLLIDSLNTQSANQQKGRAQMIELLRTLPPDTPVAVFLLGTSLRVLQGFTSDPNLLQAALDQSVSAATVSKDPNYDGQSVSSNIRNSTVGVGRNMGLASQRNTVQNFELEEYASSVDVRAKDTLAAMVQIAQYLSGVPGRKNLIWVSESFPISIDPDTRSGNNSFAGLRDYAEMVRNVANALTDAQVAVYPMNVLGVQAQQALAASQPDGQPPMRGPAVAGMLEDEDNQLQASQGTMEALARDTGGQACKKNDLSGCVTAALKDSSSYYEMSFYPQNVNWDGRFHRITVRTTRPGLKLSYRRGYYAMDGSSLAKKIPPEEHLRQACADQLPSTTIPLKVRPAPAARNEASEGGLQYMLSITAAGLGSLQDGGSYGFNVLLADCEFAEKDTTFRINERELPKTVPAEVYRGWQANGIPYRVTLRPAAETRRIRLAVLDVTSGLTGAIDIPVNAEEMAKAVVPAPVAPAPAPAAPAPSEAPPVATGPYVELPDKVKGDSPPKAMASLAFGLSASASGTLDWGGDSLTYKTEGEMPLDKVADAFFVYAFSRRFECDEGQFVPVDSADSDPVMRFTFHNHNGKKVVVDLKGDRPVYVGDLPVDPGAQAFFDQVWKLGHCK